MRSLITRALCGTLAGIIVARLIVTWHEWIRRRVSQAGLNRIAWLLAQPRPAVKPIERETALAYAAREWEGDICDLADASDVAATIIDDALMEIGTEGFALTPNQARQMLFVTYQTQRMISAFRDRYYEAIEARG